MRFGSGLASAWTLDTASGISIPRRTARSRLSTNRTLWIVAIGMIFGCGSAPEPIMIRRRLPMRCQGAVISKLLWTVSMVFDWEQFKKGLVGTPDWQDADDLARLSIESFRAERGGFRRDMSSGALRLAGAGITGHSGALDGVAETMRNFQRLILAAGLSSTGHTTLRGQPPADVVAKTRLSLNAAPLPGSLIFQIIPAMSPADQIAPNGQAEFFNDHETQLIDMAMKDALTLLEDGRQLVPDADTGVFLSKLKLYGPRVATTLRDFSLSMV